MHVAVRGQNFHGNVDDHHGNARARGLHGNGHVLMPFYQYETLHEIRYLLSRQKEEATLLQRNVNDHVHHNHGNDHDLENKRPL